MDTASKTESGIESHHPHCALELSMTSPAAGRYAPKGKKAECSCAELELRSTAVKVDHTVTLLHKPSTQDKFHHPHCDLGRLANSLDDSGRSVSEEAAEIVKCNCAGLKAKGAVSGTEQLSQNGPWRLKSSLKKSFRRTSSSGELRPRSGEPALNEGSLSSGNYRRQRLRFDLRPPHANARVQDAVLLSIVESLIRLSILSALLYSPDQSYDTPIYRRTPHSTVTKILEDAELSLLEEGSNHSQNDFNESIRAYVKTLSRDELLNRMMEPSTLPYLSQSLNRQVARFRLAVETNDRCPLGQYTDEKYRLSMDRKRLRDDYQCLLWLNSCIQTAENNEELHSSIAVTLKGQVDILIPPYRALNAGLSLPFLGTMLGEQDVAAPPLPLPPRTPPSRNPLRRFKVSDVVTFYRKWISMTISDYRHADSEIGFLLKHPIIQCFLIAGIMFWAHQKDIWIEELAYSTKTHDSKTHLIEMISKVKSPSDFGYWMIFQLSVLAVTAFPLYRAMLTDERLKVRWFLAVLAMFLSLLYALIAVVSHLLSFITPSSLEVTSFTMQLCSSCRFMAGLAVIFALLCKHYEDVTSQPDDKLVLHNSVPRLSACPVEKKKDQ